MNQDDISSQSTKDLNHVSSQQNVQVLQLQEQNLESKKKHDDIIAQYELQKASRNIIIPTNDRDVKVALREIKHPVCYFGEGPIDRRERLRNLTAKIVMESGQVPNFYHKKDNFIAQKEENEHYWYPGSQLLLKFRNQIAQSSLKKAQNRIEQQKEKRQSLDPLEEEEQIDQQQHKACNFKLQNSLFADSSVITKGVFSPNEKLYASAGGSGNCKIWTIPNCENIAILPYNIRVNTINFHPQSTVNFPAKSYGNIVTGSSDGKIFFWTLDLEIDRKQEYEFIQGHEDRVNNVLYHTNDGRYLSSVSHDKTMKLWDLETKQEIISQFGHQKPVYTQALHPDGSLLFTGDLGGSGVVWDLRTGKSIIPILGHVKQLIASSFSENGYHLATGSDDNTVKLWDLRRQSCLYTIPAHNKLISDLKFQKNGSNFLMTSSYDRTCKIWSVKDWSQTFVYENQNFKVTSINMTSDCSFMATTTMDREWMFWTK